MPDFEKKNLIKQLNFISMMPWTTLIAHLLETNLKDVLTHSVLSTVGKNLQKHSGGTVKLTRISRCNKYALIS